MYPGHINGATRTLGKPSNMSDEQCNSLAICDIVHEGFPYMVSAWMPTPEDLKRIMRGQPVYLYIQGTTHPVVMMAVPE
jgi:hypothetical protein